MNRIITPFLLLAVLGGLAEAVDPQPDRPPGKAILTNTLESAETLAAAREGLRRFRCLNTATNLVSAPEANVSADAERFEQLLATARVQREKNNPRQAQILLEQLLRADLPLEIRRPALLELGLAAQQNGELTKAQQVFATYVQRFPKDANVPEVLLRQGLLYREMGGSQMALAKFYAVMTVALHLQVDRLSYYQRIVLQAQTEIAETFYQDADYAQAAELFRRLLKLASKEINRPQIQLRILRCHARLGQHAEVVEEAEDYLKRSPAGPDHAEVRFHLATAYNGLGQSSNALQQVLLLLTNPKTGASSWPQRAGNQIANQLYVAGDHQHALELYRTLAASHATPAWRLPILYQIGQIQERLGQLPQARASYAQITRQGAQLTGVEPALQIVLDLAAWRHKTLAWFTPTEQAAKDTPLGQIPPTALP